MVIALLAVLTALVVVRPVTLLLVSSGDCSSSCTDSPATSSLDELCAPAVSELRKVIVTNPKHLSILRYNIFHHWC